MADPVVSSQSYKLHVVLPGGASFNAEGPEDTVRAQFNDFLTAIRSIVPAEVPANSKGGTGRAPDMLPREHIDRVFKVDDDVVSLLQKPKTVNVEADALVMLLWGFQQLKGREQVSALDLMAAARKSGLQIDRIDRLIKSSQHVTSGGAKRGTRYGLNNPGMVFAQKLVAEMFD